MRALMQQITSAQRALSAASLECGIRFWMWLIDTIANAIVAGITPLIGQIAFLYRMTQMRSAVVSFGLWGGLYAHGTYAYRVCLGFVAITASTCSRVSITSPGSRGRGKRRGA